MLILVLFLISCRQHENLKLDITGKWWYYDTAWQNYAEYDINQKTIGIFSHIGGNSGLSAYKIENDTLYFNGGKFEIRNISDYKLLLSIRDRIDTLTRLPDSVSTYNTINNKNDSVFNKFYEQFVNRAYKCWIKYGYVTEEELERSFISNDSIKEEKILINKK